MELFLRVLPLTHSQIDDQRNLLRLTTRFGAIGDSLVLVCTKAGLPACDINTYTYFKYARLSIDPNFIRPINKIRHFYTTPPLKGKLQLHLT